KNGTITISTDGVNYKTYTSASNSYTFDGTTIDIGKLGQFDAAAAGVDPVTVTTKKDTSSIKDTVVKFIDDYNTLISDLYSEIKTARPKKDGSYYDPLTEEQEEEMDDDEIEKWNEEAKKGLLYGDNNIQNFLSSIRSAMSSSLDGFSLSDMGITVSSDLDDYGKLIIDEDKLEASIEKYSDQISKFFTDSDNGLAAKLNGVVDKAISKTTNNYGYLTMIAGIENTTSEQKSMLYTQISSLQKLISDLEEKYENEMERYWNQFTTLETYMNQMQSQSSIFASDY
ncbi:MAG: flagellar filament capping protein FliD, partial [Oscillospiraceae bacterium]